MSRAATLRPFAPAPTRRRSRARSVETLLEEIRRLVAERQALRESATAPATLERNRRRIVRAQWELSRALIARHHSASGEQHAA